MIRGSIVALVTPMRSDETIDWECLDALVEWHIANGTQGIVPVGTTGESPTVTPKEHCEIIRAVVELTDARVPVIAGTGANSTREAIEFTASAKDSGADACLLVTPYYNRPTQRGLFLHYQAIAKAVDIPQILYNVPGRTAVDLLPATVRQLADIEQIRGIKEATGSLERAAEIRALCGDRIDIFSGDDATSCELMLQGGQGTISVTANVAPAAVAAMAEAAVAGDRASAEALNEPLLGLHEQLFLEANPIPVKWALAQMGRIPEGIRLPLTALSEDHQQPVLSAMLTAGISS
ncbi:MAG: 4-hydroxy-tetrahydrodipicolinate synthase [Gammaproteobacteria bacterium TMED95]|jgi:4-hydroxy-tetrahydrodipicolinate synthase|nr:4-hydroxy-tetrahydrodipicolinate synthase [Gammaproteobacteria bacterium]OUV19742.1 MAG: 4-hydroxy-tetrahydrodipicolinate synthase [Gammaproteobacteria bacterium TMED95]